MSAREGNNHVSKIPVEVPLVGRASLWEMKSRITGIGLEARAGTEWHHVWNGIDLYLL